MAAHRKLDRRRDDLFAGALRKRAPAFSHAFSDNASQGSIAALFPFPLSATK